MFPQDTRHEDDGDESGGDQRTRNTRVQRNTIKERAGPGKVDESGTRKRTPRLVDVSFWLGILTGSFVEEIRYSDVSPAVEGSFCLT